MVIVIKFLDKHVGNAICNFLALFNRKKPDSNDISSILVIQLWGIGESILTLPAVDALRKKFPKAELNVLVTSRNEDVYYNNKNINKTVKINLNPFSILNFIIKNNQKYDFVIDMEEYLNISSIISFFVGKRIVGYSHNARARLYTSKVKYNDKQHAVQTFLDLARVLNINYTINNLPKLNFSKNDKRFVDKFLKNNNIKSNDFVVCVAPGAAESAKARMWPYERYAELCDEIASRYNAKIIFAGASNEAELIDEIQKNIENNSKTINAAGKITLNQLFYLIGKSNLFIGNDAGPMHIAAAQGVKTLGLFGPNLPLRFGPYGKGNIGFVGKQHIWYFYIINVLSKGKGQSLTMNWIWWEIYCDCTN